MFVDELTFTAAAGAGGHGVIRWQREKYKPKGGPAGGNGGSGGDVYVRGVKDLNRLSHYTGRNHFVAPSGESGDNKSQHGHNGADYYIDIPIGSRVTDVERRRVFEVTAVGETVKILKGGAGGYGNEHFKSSTNVTPEEATSGRPGEEGTFRVEVALVVDIGLVGLPNAGKSTLLNTLTNARSAVGAYPFTTLEPHLGSLHGHTIADIPGLIAGAATGKGLGHKFLRHVTRTRMLLHLVSLEQPDPLATYQTVRQELEAFSADLVAKPEWVILSKSDLATTEQITTTRAAFEAMGHTVYVVSEQDAEAIKQLQDPLLQHLSAQA